MKRKIVIFGLAAIGFLGITCLVYAQNLGSGPGAGSPWGEKLGLLFREPWKGLNLTPEQKVKFQEMVKNFIQENAQLIGSLVAKRVELLSLWTDPNSNTEAILAKEKESRDLENQMRDKAVQKLLEARKVLTAEQISKIRTNWGIVLGGMMGGGRRFLDF